MKYLRIFFALVTTCCLLSAISGCGYTTHSLLAEKYHTINVENFVNRINLTNEADAASKYKIYKPLLEVDITRAVNDRFLFDGNLRPAKTGTADLTLRGELIEFRREPLSYTTNEEVLQYRMNITVTMSLYDNKENKQLWQEARFAGEVNYFTQGPSAISDDQAVSKTIYDLARRIVERTVDAW